MSGDFLSLLSKIFLAVPCTEIISSSYSYLPTAICCRYEKSDLLLLLPLLALAFFCRGELLLPLC